MARSRGSRRIRLLKPGYWGVKHYLRGKKWFTNLGDVSMCNCGNLWPCNKAKDK